MKLSTIPCMWAAAFTLVSAGPQAAAPVPRIQDAPRMPTDQTLARIARSLNAIRAEGQDQTFSSNKTVLDTTWTGATLLKQSVSVTPSMLAEPKY